jgi:hypothetical protein
MVGLANAEASKSLLQMFLPMTPDEKYNDIQIQRLNVPVPIPVNLAFIGDTLLLCNDLDAMKKVMDATVNKKATGLFQSFDPPLDPAVPRYNALIINPSYITNVLFPVAMMAGGVPQDIVDKIEPVTKNVKQLCITGDMRGNWLEKSTKIYLK